MINAPLFCYRDFHTVWIFQPILSPKTHILPKALRPQTPAGNASLHILHIDCFYTENVVDWQVESAKAFADMLLLWVIGRQTGVSLYTPQYIYSLSFLPAFFFLLAVHYLSASL